MHHAAHGVGLLEMVEPPFALGGINQRALVRAVYVCGALLQHHLALIRAVQLLGAEHCLPALANTALWYDKVVPAVLAKELGTLGHRSGIDCVAVIQKLTSVGTHAVQNDGTGSVGASAQIGVALVIPNGTGILPLGYILYVTERLPGAFGFLGAGHEQALIGGAEIDPETASVIADGGSP